MRIMILHSEYCQIKLRGFTGLTPKNINLIVENCNLDRAKLNNELEKILIFF